MPITRRALFKVAMFGACTPPRWPAPAVHASVPSTPRQLPVGSVFFDARSHHALSFAETACSSGARTYALHEAEWQRQWGRLLARTPAQQAALAGMTDVPTLMLHQAMAADAGMRLVLRVHHHQTVERGRSHEVFGEPIYRDAFHSRCMSPVGDWACALGRLVMSLPECRSGAQPIAVSDAADVNALAARTMVTWVIA